MSKNQTEKQSYQPLGHQPGLDGLRGIAVISVVLVHMFPTVFPGGVLGVDVFFVLSGFLITCLLFEEHAKKSCISYTNFVYRRALRLLPALVVMLLCYLCYRFIYDDGWKEFKYSVIRVIINLVFLVNWCYLYKWYPLNELAYLWSLSVEWQFYLVWPIIISMVTMARKSIILILMSMIVLASLFVSVYYSINDPPYMYVATDARAHQLLIGAFAGALYHFGILPKVTLMGQVTGLVCLAIVIYLISLKLSYEYVRQCLALLSVAIIVVSVQSRSSLLNSILTNSVLSYIGAISYGLFIWHQVVLAVIDDRLISMSFLERRFLAVIVFVVLTLLSYYLVEKRFMKLRSKSKRV